MYLNSGSEKKKKSLHMEKTEEVFPLPTRVLSNGEFDPPPQNSEQRRVQALMTDLAERFAKPHGMERHRYLQTPSGLAVAFLAMNTVYGPHFEVGEGEASDPAQGEERVRSLADQFIFDDQLHFAHDDYKRRDVLALREYAKWRLNPSLRGEKRRMDRVRFRNFFKEVYLESDTKVGLLTSATADNEEDWFLSNRQIARGRDTVNAMLGSKRLLTHALFAPGHPGWLEEIDRALSEDKPDAWKGYPVGDPFHYSRFPYRLDDEELVYPAYEKLRNAGVRNICIHKGLMPLNFLKRFANWRYGSVDDVPKAARDWPDLNFIIYHAAFRPSLSIPSDFLENFERTGRMEWVTDLADIPLLHGVNNVYADLGTTFGVCSVAHPRIAAAVLGTLIEGLGEDHVLWGTDSIWYGSPQWQVEALRRIEIPEDMQMKHRFKPLGGPNSEIKQKILGMNGAKLYGLDPHTSGYARGDGLTSLREAYAAAGPEKDEFLEDLFRKFPQTFHTA